MRPGHRNGAIGWHLPEIMRKRLDSTTAGAVQQSMRFSSDYVSSFCQRDSTLEVVRSARAWQGGGGGMQVRRTYEQVQHGCCGLLLGVKDAGCASSFYRLSTRGKTVMRWAFRLDLSGNGEENMQRGRMRSALQRAPCQSELSMLPHIINYRCV